MARIKQVLREREGVEGEQASQAATQQAATQQS
jgi:hypothetical protein